MRNKLSDLNNHLFAQMEKLSEEGLSGEDLKTEIDRAKAMADIAGHIVGAAKVTVDALKLVSNGNLQKTDLPMLLNDK
jgi:hypothetical protein